MAVRIFSFANIRESFTGNTGLSLSVHVPSQPREPMEGHIFGMKNDRGWIWVFFPLWFPAVTFALAGVGTLRLGRRFTLRSALIATTVVAGLLGMVVAL
jgi:hypothetical protein